MQAALINACEWKGKGLHIQSSNLSKQHYIEANIQMIGLKTQVPTVLWRKAVKGLDTSQGSRIPTEGRALPSPLPRYGCMAL